MVKKILFILLALYSLLFLLGGISAPVLAHYKIYDLSGMLTYLFSGSCHQMPDRSFWIMGYPMALCSRCTGIYAGSFFGCMHKIIFNKNYTLLMFIVFIIIALSDIALNFLFAINTGLYIRFFAGILIGLVFVEVLSRFIDFVLNYWKKYTKNRKV